MNSNRCIHERWASQIATPSNMATTHTVFRNEIDSEDTPSARAPESFTYRVSQESDIATTSRPKTFTNRIYDGEKVLAFTHKISDNEKEPAFTNKISDNEKEPAFTNEIYDIEKEPIRHSRTLSKKVHHHDSTPPSTLSHKDLFKPSKEHSAHTAGSNIFQFQNTTTPSSTRTLSFYRLGCHRDLVVRDDGGVAIYFADISRYTRRPDITLHAGSDESHPAVAIARFRCSRNLHLGIGDPANEPSMVWQELKNTKWCSYSQYRLEPSSQSDHRRVLLWQRTWAGADGVKGFMNKMSLLNYRLVDEGSGEVMAVFLASGLKSWKKTGKLLIKNEWIFGEAEILAVLGLCGLIEKAWRRAQRQQMWPL